MKLIGERIKLRHIVINLAITSILVFFIYFLSGPYVKGLLFHIGAILSMPSFLIISLFIGAWEAMHFVPFILDKLVSFIFYSAVIALIQVIVFKWRKKRKDKAMAKT
ncbi:MAG: hypothetical protein M1508_10965 [Nitrospirae bacterium]|nr:hypothetical protein [Nitrospirota bacterium]MCL5420984.1 hypothetical protein [Nitrospirota bacterium]